MITAGAACRSLSGRVLSCPPARRWTHSPGSFVQDVRALDQHVHAVGADDADSDGGDDAEDEAGVEESQGHGQDAGSERSLQQVDESVRVPAGKNKVKTVCLSGRRQAGRPAT